MRGYICRLPPPVCQYDRGFPPSPLLRAEERLDLPRPLPGWNCVNDIKCIEEDSDDVMLS
jgi:hypothetical protein